MPLDKDYDTNPNTPPLPMRAPDVGKLTAEFEAEITLRTKSILRAVMKQIPTTRWTTEIDKLIRQVNVRFAYDSLGLNQLPVHWRPGFNEAQHNWWVVLRYQLVGLVYLYYKAVADHDLGSYVRHANRLDEMVEGRIANYKLSPGEPSGYVLRTQKEWNDIVTESDRRETEILDNKDKLSR